MVEDGWDVYGLHSRDILRDDTLYSVLQWSSLTSQIYRSFGLDSRPCSGSSVCKLYITIDLNCGQFDQDNIVGIRLLNFPNQTFVFVWLHCILYTL